MKSSSESLMLYGRAAATWNIFQAESHHQDNNRIKDGKEEKKKRKKILSGREIKTS